MSENAVPSRPWPLTYVAVGASDTVGLGTEDPLRQAWPQLFRRSLPPGTEFVNLGISGATTAEVLSLAAPEVERHQPDLVTIWLNVNDLLVGVPVDTYEGHMRRLVNRVRRGGAATVLVANTPPLERLPAYMAWMADALAAAAATGGAADRKTPRPETVVAAVASYNEAIARVVAAEGAVLVDLHTASLRAREQGVDHTHIAADGFHPSPAGHAAVAEVFAETLAATGLLTSPGGRRASARPPRSPR